MRPVWLGVISLSSTLGSWGGFVSVFVVVVVVVDVGLDAAAPAGFFPARTEA